MASSEERIAALVERALGTDSEEEARTSALIAIRLAAKTGAVIRVKRRGEKEEKRKVHVEAESTSTRAEPPDVPFEDFRDWVYESYRRQNGGARRDKPSASVRDPRSFRNRFATSDGTCKHCGGTWHAGEVIAQREGEKRSYHAGCAAQRR